MATEYAPTLSILLLENWVMSAQLVPGAPQQARFPATNLLDDKRSSRYRSPDDSVVRRVPFDLGTAKAPNAFGLVDANLVSGQVAFVGADDSGLTVNVQTVTFNVYAQGSSKILRWYADTHDGGGAIGARRFWAPELKATTTGGAGFHEAGVVWIGQRTEVGIALPIDSTTRDLSKVVSSDSGARHYLRRGKLRESTFDTGLLESTAFWDLEEKLDRAGAASPILVDPWAMTADGKRGGPRYGNLSDRPYRVSQRLQTRGSISIDFIEAAA